MPSSRAPEVSGVVLALLCAVNSGALADPPPAAGFAVERLYQSAPGAGWVVMDSLDMSGGLSGALSLSIGYAHDPLRITSAAGATHLTVISDQAFADVGAAVTYDRFRLYLNLESPLVVSGLTAHPQSFEGYQFTSPTVTLGTSPDTFSDARVGFDARVVGRPGSPLRLGVGGQLYLPSGRSTDYVTDGTVRAMGRILMAGDYGLLSYAAQLGVQLRAVGDDSTPGSPRGDELLFGIAAGPRFLLANGAMALIAGPEIYGETAFRAFLGSTATGIEGLASARIEGTGVSCRQLRLKLGVGGGIDPNFGAPEWRAVIAVEIFDRPTEEKSAPAAGPGSTP